MLRRSSLTLLVSVLTLLAAQSAAAADRAGPAGLVFAQTNEPSGNQIVVFDRDANGGLSRAGAFATGGSGSAAVPGTESDHLGSQGSLAYDPAHHLLIAVNAGSNSVSALRVVGDRLQLLGVVPSGGDFPASVAIHGDLVYVLNSGSAGVVQGFRVSDSGLTPIAGSGRSLGLTNSNPPFFLESPGQVGFSPDGSKLIVTTKKSGSTIDVFAVGADGLLSSTPSVDPSATPVPFAFTFAPSGRLVVGEAGTSSLTTYRLQPDGTLAEPKSLSDGQTALCWVQQVGDYYYVSNTGSNTISAFTIGADGRPALVGGSDVATTTDAGPIDETSPPGSHLLYVETGTAGTIEAFAVNADGSLTRLQDVTGLPPGLEGIASS